MNRFSDIPTVISLPKLNDTKPSTHELLVILDEWQKKYPFQKEVIIFQNKEWLSNIRFTSNSFHELQKHSRGAENLPGTLIHPTEIWSYWDDPKVQMVTWRHYILIGSNISYIVKTKDAVVMDAFAVTASQVSRYRKGLLLLK